MVLGLNVDSSQVCETYIDDILQLRNVSLHQKRVGTGSFAPAVAPTTETAEAADTTVSTTITACWSSLAT